MLIDILLKNKGYMLKEEDKYGVVYEKYIKEYYFVHVISIRHKASGNHIVQSYDKHVHKVRVEDDKYDYINSVCGLDTRLLLLLWMKTKYLSFKYRWFNGWDVLIACIAIICVTWFLLTVAR